jgi:hypothetical protein
MSNTTRDRSSAVSLALPVTRPGIGGLQYRQFLFDTNKPFSFITNFSTHTKQSTSFFLFDTNERLRIADHRSVSTNIVARTGKIACATEG